MAGRTVDRRYRGGGSSTKPKRPFAERNGKYMTTEEVADYFGVTLRKVERMIGLGELKVTKIGKLIRIHVDDIAEYERTARGEDGR
jgi:excisionase family DNA binding protein